MLTARLVCHLPVQIAEKPQGISLAVCLGEGIYFQDSNLRSVEVVAGVLDNYSHKNPLFGVYDPFDLVFSELLVKILVCWTEPFLPDF